MFWLSAASVGSSTTTKSVLFFPALFSHTDLHMFFHFLLAPLISVGTTDTELTINPHSKPAKTNRHVPILKGISHVM